MTEWQPVVGGRCMWGTLPVELVEHVDGGMVIVRRLDQGASVPVEITDLTEHPDDRRARRLLEAAREAGKTWAAMRGAKAPKLQAEAMREHAAAINALRAIVAEYDQAEADHA